MIVTFWKSFSLSWATHRNEEPLNRSNQKLETSGHRHPSSTFYSGLLTTTTQQLPLGLFICILNCIFLNFLKSVSIDPYCVHIFELVNSLNNFKQHLKPNKKFNEYLIWATKMSKIILPNAIYETKNVKT